MPTPKPLPWFYRSPKITVPAGGAVNYPISTAQAVGNGEPFYRVPSVVVSVEGSTTVKAAAAQVAPDGFVITLRNELTSGPQSVRFNVAAWDAYAGDSTP